MATCASCGSTMFGGKKLGNMRFCSEKCLKNGKARGLGVTVPDDILGPAVAEAHAQNCPKCQGPGPVDIHMAHKVWSLLVLTRWYSEPQMTCKKCATKAQGGAMAFCALAGWWGFPWGIIMTPVQILRNISGMVGGPKSTEPSAQLREAVNAHLVAVNEALVAQRAADEELQRRQAQAAGGQGAETLRVP